MGRLARRLGFGFVLLAVCGVVASLVLVAGRLAPAARAANATVRGCAQVPGSDPVAVRSLFVVSAVLRDRPACSYALVTPGLRQGLSRREWATGNIPIVPFATAARRTVRMEAIGERRTAASLTTYLVLRSADAGRSVFELVMVRSGDRWRVAYWAPAGGVGAFSAA